MKNTYLAKIIISFLPVLSITLLLFYIFFDLNSKIGGLGFILFSIYDTFEIFISLKNKNDLNTLSLLLNLIMLILGIQMILYPSIF
ncbi:hypothetical protein [Faecalimicrobium dakarense]|uniref:hypothetical protein n=1 Tax=Faecalimicrobium dakarense TaxID=1301100 RepID=UPI0004B64D94|nr:hypothetical protein [[Clostridium] dakarense]